ncbi:MULTISPECIES: multidrug resistance efflux transporter family protein [Psychrobacter]|uniref:multidrug resistance efflux transporter family protein n=1 Tax=Psychrobacter TaxID=497 RepID=UPI00146CEBCB|nr:MULTISPECIES: multidrug resistance efflux transporter family protein [Psychrobacter]
MVKLILLGLLAGALFSSTFILNELMSGAGGHWFWSASLRYVFMWLLLTLIISVQHGFGRIKALATIFRDHWAFWCISGTIGFGLFYTGICYAGDHAAGWVVAATFMFTVVTSLLVLVAFGQRFAKKFIAYALIVFVGVAMVNISEGLRATTAIDAAAPMSQMLIFGALPALIAAFCYPIGNQLVWQVSYNSRNSRSSRNLTSDNANAEPSQPKSMLERLIAKVPAIDTDLLQNAFNKVWLMTLGSMPFWLILGIIVRPDAPSGSQMFNTLLVALLAGVGATSIFFFARERAVTSSEVAGVDSTQASEVIFALIGGIILLNNALPSAMGLVGVGLIIIGLILFAKNG